MRRIVVITIAVAALMGSGIGALVMASPASATSAARAAGLAGARPHGTAASGPIGSGATYTYYDEESGPSDVFCEVLTFGTKTFAGSQGDQGTYKSTKKSVTVTFQNGAAFAAAVFTGAFDGADAAFDGLKQYGGNAKLGSGTADPGKLYGPSTLVQGNDPWGVGSCG